jgi:hypothetical protein
VPEVGEVVAHGLGSFMGGAGYLSGPAVNCIRVFRYVLQRRPQPLDRGALIIKLIHKLRNLSLLPFNSISKFSP